MGYREHRELIKHRALFAKEKADIIGNKGLKEDAEKVLELLKNHKDIRTAIQSTAYSSVLKCWYK